MNSELLNYEAYITQDLNKSIEFYSGASLPGHEYKIKDDLDYKYLPNILHGNSGAGPENSSQPGLSSYEDLKIGLEINTAWAGVK